MNLPMPERARVRGWRLLCAALPLALSACASIPEEQCASVDWRRLGYDDGRAGYADTRLAEHRDACKGVGVEPDQARWLAGRTDGLREYCQLPNALGEGRAGRPYRGVCPGPLDPPFRDLHGAAYAAHEAGRRMREVESTLSSRERELRKDNLSDRDRNRIRSEIRELDRRRDALRDERYRREAELDRVRARLGL